MAIGRIAGSIGGVAAATGQLTTDFTLVTDALFGTKMRPASIGGVPFGVYDARLATGRRNAVHEYPKRDEVWVEDMGMQPRRFDIVGFLVENSIVYGGGSLDLQRMNLLAVIENLPSATLVHPTLGTIPEVNCLDFEMSERVDLGRVIEFRASLIKGGPRIYPSAQAAADQLGPAADVLDGAAVADFAATVVAPLKVGAAAVQAVVSTALGYYGLAVQSAHDVRRFWSSVSRLPGEFGRCFGGANAGLKSNATAGAATTSTLLAADTRARAAIGAAGASLKAAAAVPTDTAGFAASVTALSAAVVASAADPADGVRLAGTMARYAPAAPASTAVIGAAVSAVIQASAALMRRAALASAVRAAAAYQPASLDEARALRTGITDLIGIELLAAGDAGDNASYSALRALRKVVSTNLDSRSGGLPAMKTFRFAEPMPSLSLAHRIYADTSRAPGLVKQANPFHPAFVPTTFRALAK